MNFTSSIATAILAFTAGISAAPTHHAPAHHEQHEHRQSPSTKRGLAYNDASLTGVFPSGSVSWAYNWASSPQGQIPAGIEYVPMLFNGNDDSWDANVQAAVAAGSTHLLGMNEPDQPTSVGGTSLDAAGAAQTYISRISQPYAGKLRLGAPAVSAGGLSWLQDFANACAGACNIDFVPLHFYDYDHPDPATQFASFQGWLESAIPQVRAMFGNPNLEIWVTEFAVTPFTDTGLATAYLGQALGYLDGNADVTRYSYFEAADGMLTSGGGLSDSGNAYVS